ncbi:hypothetical protein RclHR1_00990015 [Rhizophagus clarus]|nr:hypothetical protein RclHR1_00990015 [Rhizophagus clarus]
MDRSIDIEISTACISSSISDDKDLFAPFPPPMNAEEFILRNLFQASDGHIKRPSNNFEVGWCITNF